MAGPAIAGVLIGAVGVSSVYWIDAGTFAAAVIAVVGLHPAPPVGGRVPFGMRSMAEGFRYLRGRPALQGTFIADLNAMVFGMPRALFPAIGLVRLGGGAGTVGLLYAAPGGGVLVGAVLTGWVAGAPPGPGGPRGRRRLGPGHHPLRVVALVGGRAPVAGAGRRRRRGVGRVPGDHAATDHHRRPAGAAVGRARRRRDRRSPPRRPRSRRRGGPGRGRDLGRLRRSRLPGGGGPDRLAPARVCARYDAGAPAPEGVVDTEATLFEAGGAGPAP